MQRSRDPGKKRRGCLNPGWLKRGVAGRHHHKSHHSPIDFQFLILIASSYGLKHKEEKENYHNKNLSFQLPKQFRDSHKFKIYMLPRTHL